MSDEKEKKRPPWWIELGLEHFWKIALVLVVVAWAAGLLPFTPAELLEWGKIVIQAMKEVG